MDSHTGFGESSPFSQAKSSFLKTPIRYRRLKNKGRKVTACKAGELRWETAQQLPNAATPVNKGRAAEICSPEMINSRLRLRMKFIRWVTRKLKKYPRIPKRGSRK